MSFLKSLRTVEPSQTLLINEQSRLAQSKGEKIYKLGFGQSPFRPVDRVIQALKDNAHEHGYIPVQGLPALREAATKFHNEMQGLNLKPENCLVGTGSKILLYAAMAAFKEADVLIPSPAWVSYEPQAHLLGHNVVRVESSFDNRWRVEPDALDAACVKCRDGKQKIMILNYPGNPEGLTYTKEQLKALAAVMKKHKILVLADEIYAFLTHDATFESLATYYPEGTIITSGLSKWSGAGGWRIGLAFLPEGMEDLKTVLLGIASETYSCANAPEQNAAVVAYKNDEVTQKYLANQRAILKILAAKSHTALTAAGIKVHEAEGGFYFYVDFTPFKEKFNAQGINTSEKLCLEILKNTGVALLHSAVFGIPAEYLSARLAYVDFDGTKALKAAEKEEINDEFVEKYCAYTLEGIRGLADWMKNVDSLSNAA
ncbi:MAG: aminotransferase [Alphaproteobacteria bacterium CG11_big_fil_rev_8_21_14_0_20_39_49]|nr:MAG: aminotransferase [Alphaproteobacteria bacterium CG11_big_fil_rev_8_21_14_0_20_39_49]